MKLVCLYLTMLGLPLAAGEHVPQTLPGGWVLDWHEEFNGSRLNDKKWRPELGVVRNYGAAQTYTRDSICVKDGLLTITTEAAETPVCNYRPGSKKWTEQRKTMPYKSGSITTRGIKNFFHGRLEVRAKVPGNKGAWPAIWLINDNPWEWPQCGEIDIMEHASQQHNCCHATIHWGRNGGNQDAMVNKHPVVDTLTDDFHVFWMEWDKTAIRLGVDKQEIISLETEKITYPDGRNPFRKGGYLIINTAVGGPGTMTEAPDAAQYPCRFQVDYVRYYVKRDAPRGQGRP